MVQSRMAYPIHLEQRKWEKDVEQLERIQLDITHELAKMARVMGEDMKVSQEQMEHCHVRALAEMQKYNGVVGFENRLEG